MKKKNVWTSLPTPHRPNPVIRILDTYLQKLEELKEFERKSILQIIKQLAIPHILCSSDKIETAPEGMKEYMVLVQKEFEELPEAHSCYNSFQDAEDCLRILSIEAKRGTIFFICEKIKTLEKE